jgi:hypothetical protein
MPGTILVFFKGGPFAWNGIMTFWVPFGAFFMWIIVMTRLLLRAVDKPDEYPVVADGSLDELRAHVEVLTGRMAEMATEVTQLRESAAKQPTP